MPALPLKTLGEIFSHLSPTQDFAALANCSLVCSDWKSVSKPHKFQEIDVKNDGEFYAGSQ